MRAVTVVGALLAGGASTLSAQHAHQVELGGFGTYTRYDKAFQLDNQFGGGGRVGFFLSNALGLELDGTLAYPNPTAGGKHTQMRWGSASLVLNSGGDRNILYLLGGYSRMDNGVNAPYNFVLNAAHAGIGDRIFITDRFALRLEARGYYSPDSAFGKTSSTHILGSVGLSYFFFGGPPAEKAPEIPKARRDSIVAAGGKVPERPRPRPGGGGGGGGGRASYEQRTGDWTHKWFWGGQGGIMSVKTNLESISFQPTVGGHWLITGTEAAMYVSYDQAVFISPQQWFVLASPNLGGTFKFDGVRRVMAGMLAFPVRQRIEPFGGGGFAIMQARGIEATTGSCLGCGSSSDSSVVLAAANNQGTRAFVWIMGGIDINQGRLALFGHYILTSSSGNFAIQGSTNTIQGGIRYSLGSAKEVLTEGH